MRERERKAKNPENTLGKKLSREKLRIEHVCCKNTASISIYSALHQTHAHLSIDEQLQ